MLPRSQEKALYQALANNKLVLVEGPRFAGKMLLLGAIIQSEKWTLTQVDCTVKSARKKAGNLSNLCACTDRILLLDEAQFLPNLDEVLEAVMSGQIQSTVIVSYSFAPKIDELLIEAIKCQGMHFKINAPTFHEAAQHFGLPEEERLLEERMIYGNYPSVIDQLDQAETNLNELIEETIITRMNSGGRINKKQELLHVLAILADRIGEPLSYNEIGEYVGLDNETVERYIHFLIGSGILIKLEAFHSEKRYELKKANLLYFMDNGIRNAIIRNFNPTYLRSDMERLWKNYLVSERKKWIDLNGYENQLYFWRSHSRQQVDIVEIGTDKRAYSLDWIKKKKPKFSKLFMNYYPDIKLSSVNRSSYWPFLTRKNK